MRTFMAPYHFAGPAEQRPYRFPLLSFRSDPVASARLVENCNYKSCIHVDALYPVPESYCLTDLTLRLAEKKKTVNLATSEALFSIAALFLGHESMQGQSDEPSINDKRQSNCMKQIRPQMPTLQRRSGSRCTYGPSFLKRLTGILSLAHHKSEIKMEGRITRNTVPC